MKLTPLNPQSNKTSEIVHNFERVDSKTKTKQSDLPILNFDDDRPWMPGIYSNHEEKQLLEKKSQERKEAFEREVINRDDHSLLEKLMLPKPPKNLITCGICNTEVEDYLTHVNSENHMENFKNNSDIQELIQEVGLIQEDFLNSVFDKIDCNELSPKKKFSRHDDSRSEKDQQTSDLSKTYYYLQNNNFVSFRHAWLSKGKDNPILQVCK